MHDHITGAGDFSRLYKIHITTGAQVDSRTRPVVDLECLVVARALDVLGEEELGRSGCANRTRGCGRRGHDEKHGAKKRAESAGSPVRRNRPGSG